LGGGERKVFRDGEGESKEGKVEKDKTGFEPEQKLTFATFISTPTLIKSTKEKKVGGMEKRQVKEGSKRRGVVVATDSKKTLEFSITGRRARK